MLWEGLGAKWGIPGPWEAQTEAVAITLNQKVVDKFFKGLRREGGSSPGRSAAASCKPSPSSRGKALSPSLFFFFNSRNYDLCRKWRLTTIHRYSLSHRLSNSLMMKVQDMSNHIPQSINICLFLDAENLIFFFYFREDFYLFCTLFTLSKLQRGLEKKPQGEDQIHPWD